MSNRVDDVDDDVLCLALSLIICLCILAQCLCVLQLKQMEVQLEEEYEDKQKVLREKRELESKLLNAQDQVLSSLCLWSLSVQLSACDLVWATSFDWKENAFESGEVLWVLKEDGEVMCNNTGCKEVVCHSGEPEGCGDREEAEERLEANQGPSG